MSNWQGESSAPSYSQEVEKASNEVRAAVAALLETMRREYPVHSRVRVVHHRGQFFGVVTGHDTHGVRVIVRNSTTGKISKWWARHVEVTSVAIEEGSAA